MPSVPSAGSELIIQFEVMHLDALWDGDVSPLLCAY